MRPSALPTALLAAVGLATSLVASAQTPPVNSEIQITKIETAFVDSPKLSAGGYSKKTQGRPGQWLEVEVTFDRSAKPPAPKYAGELTFNYYILLTNDSGEASDGKKNGKPTLLTGSVTHVNTPAEKGLHAVAYVSPRTLQQLFAGKPPVNPAQTVKDIGVEVKGEGGLLAIGTKVGRLGGTAQAPVGWWSDTAGFSPLPGFVLAKSQTPFANLEWDYFEPEKPKSGN